MGLFGNDCDCKERFEYPSLKNNGTIFQSWIRTQFLEEVTKLHFSIKKLEIKMNDLAKLTGYEWRESNTGEWVKIKK